MPWSDDEPTEQPPKWSPAQTVAGDTRPEAPRVTDSLVMLVLGVVVAIAVVAIAVKLWT